MTARLRDTAFGRMARLLSSKRLFRYLDEIDLSLWEEVPSRSSPLTSSPPQEQADADCTTKECDTQDRDLRHLSANPVVEDGQEVCLVYWYGPDDPEVSAPKCFSCDQDNISHTRVPESTKLA